MSSEPPLDVGLAAERTAMAWQRTALALAVFAAVLVRLADRDLVVAVPGLAGMALGLALLVLGQRRYSRIVDQVQADRSSQAPRLVAVLTLGTAVLSAASLVFVVMVET
ncbi:MAG TPA: DUF202 domain-containing protein [Nocardioidaceae bacterium]